MLRLKKKKHSPSPLKKLHWWLLHNGPRRHVTVDTKNGKISFDSKDNCVGKHIFFQREYDIGNVKEFTGWLEAYGYVDKTAPGLVLNVGANIGLLATALKLYSVFEDIVTFEPVPANFELLKKNIKQNSFEDSIDCVNLALSSTDGEVKMELSDNNFGDHRVRRTIEKGELGESERKTVLVNMSRLDTFMNREYSDRNVGLIWMDIQGHEGDFFIGAKDIIIAGRVPTVSEFWPYGIARSGMSKNQFCEVVSSMYTHFYNPDDTKLWPIKDMDGMFERYAGPEVGTNIIFVNETWKKN